MDTDRAVDRVISAFGGLTGLSRALGHKNPTTVQGWRDRGIIPSRQIPEIIEAGQRMVPAIDLTPADFFYTAERRASRPEARA